ncbi:hypothetical protein HIM_00277 [Hirsutella minnesotensis 3608]|nr:hypothetical protein HIM_00277 [Hirsutella minnesotensis 3608]
MASEPGAAQTLLARGEQSQDPDGYESESALDAPLEHDELDELEDNDDVAPRYNIAPRRLAAVEIPAVVNNIDRAVKAFGRVASLSHVMDPLRSSLPLYLNPESPFCPSIMSHNARSHNVVLKITVPKRTGRKRKRGTDDPWQGDVEAGDASAKPSAGEVQSIARLDEPKVLRRKMADNADRYEIEAVGIIKHTHRFRGLADFHWDMSKSSLAQRYVEQVLPGDIQQMKTFKFAPGVDKGPNVDILPPPLFTHMTLPFNYNYSQNPYVRATEDGDTINLTAVKQVGYFIGADDPTPSGPQLPPDLTDPRTLEIIAELESAFDERPVWTRRSLLNHLGDKLRNWNDLKKYLNYAAYQFKGGPWRDGVVPYGIDPRTDPKYRIYQTLMFKLARRNHHLPAGWRSIQKSQPDSGQDPTHDDRQSHMFDGQSYCTDGKVWQVCDITDPLLKELFDKAAIRPTWDVNSGWYHGGFWAKVKAIMKTKLVGIQFGRRLTRLDFAATLNCGDKTPTKTASATMHIPLPNLRLTTAELTVLRGREPAKRRNNGYNVRFGDASRNWDSGATSGPEAAAAASEAMEGATEMEIEGDDDDDDSSESGIDYEGDEDDENLDAPGEEYPDQLAYSDGEVAEEDKAFARAPEEDDVFAPTGSVPYPAQLHYHEGRDLDENVYAQEMEEDDGLAPMGGAIYPELD